MFEVEAILGVEPLSILMRISFSEESKSSYRFSYCVVMPFSS